MSRGDWLNTGSATSISSSAASRRITSIGALLGVTYVPGYGYLVLVGPVWFILIADLVEAGLRAVDRRSPRAWFASGVVTVGVLLLFAMRLVNRRLELQTDRQAISRQPARN